MLLNRIEISATTSVIPSYLERRLPTKKKKKKKKSRDGGSYMLVEVLLNVSQELRVTTQIHGWVKVIVIVMEC